MTNARLIVNFFSFCDSPDFDGCAFHRRPMTGGAGAQYNCRMPQQNYTNHAQYVPMFHFVLFPALVLTLIGSVVNLYHSIGDHQRLYSASLICVLTLCVLVLQFLARVFALKAQDRAIRAEENLRHYVLTGKLLDARLSTKQIIGLRFASDKEFPELARKAAEQNLPPGEIKKAVKDWRADLYRV